MHTTRSLNLISSHYGIKMDTLRSVARTFGIKIRNNGDRWFIADSAQVETYNDYVKRNAANLANRW